MTMEDLTAAWNTARTADPDPALMAGDDPDAVVGWDVELYSTHPDGAPWGEAFVAEFGRLAHMAGCTGRVCGPQDNILEFSTQIAARQAGGDDPVALPSAVQAERIFRRVAAEAGMPGMYSRTCHVRAITVRDVRAGQTAILRKFLPAQ